MAAELLVRFLLGGAIVSAFSATGDLFKPKTFAGIFGGAPSVALATLGLTWFRHGGHQVATECRSMLIGAIALAAYSFAAWFVLRKTKVTARTASLALWGVWFGVAFGGWAWLLRGT